MLLPAGVGLLGRHLDHSQFRDNPLYKALVPVAVWGSLALAVVIPTVLVLTARIPLIYRLALTVGVWVLLALELYCVFVIVVFAH